MAKIYDFGAYRAGPPPRDQPPLSRNREILARLQARLKAADTPETRLVNELRGLEETLLGNHRRYARLWEDAERLGLKPPLPTPSEIGRDPRPYLPGPGDGKGNDRER
jgi:hypothetical protein